MPSRIFNRKPRKMHLTRGNGLGGEIADLRRDVDETFAILEESVDIHTEPIKLVGWNGAQQTITLLDTDHEPNVYEVRVVGSILSDDGNGFYVLSPIWHDPDLGDQTIDSDSIAITGILGPALPYSRSFFSDGLGPIKTKIEGFGQWPTLGVSLYLQVARIG